MDFRPKPLAGAGEWSAGVRMVGVWEDGRWELMEGPPHFGEGKAYLKGGSFQSPGLALEPRFRPAASIPRPVWTRQLQYLPRRAVQGPSVRAVSGESLVPRPGSPSQVIYGFPPGGGPRPRGRV